MLKQLTLHTLLLIAAVGSLQAQTALTDYVDPFLGTAPLTDNADIGYERPPGWRVWAGLVFPGASLPNAMVQLSPMTEFGSGAGYEYEDSTIYAFTHTNKGHWNLCHIPMLPVCGNVSPTDFGSHFSHDNESAHPGYYQVLLDRYQINAELTTSLRCGYHRYTYVHGQDKKLIVNLGTSNERVHGWDLQPDGPNAFKGYQKTGSRVCFYAVCNHTIQKIETLGQNPHRISVIHFEKSDRPLEIKVALSFVSIENAHDNLREIADKNFQQVRTEANAQWQALLSKIRVTGGSPRQKKLFYSSLYRSFLWPALRSDLNGQFRNAKGQIVQKDFKYYTIPSLWDTYRNKLVLLGMLSPRVTQDVIQSLIDRGEKRGFMPTFFHGDHAAVFVAGSYLRGLTDFDVRKAYQQLLNNATLEGGTRPFITEYAEKGYISTTAVEKPVVETKGKAAVTKTLEYAYDDYALALLAKALKDESNDKMLTQRSGCYKNLFDPSTGLMRGRTADGHWVEPFNPQYPYYEYMYREANAWQSSFFAPHDMAGLIGLYESPAAFERQVDRLFSIPWNTHHIARNISGFIGQYCHGNQPDHSSPYLYYWTGKPEKSQAIIDQLLERFYGMGKDGLALCGMDDAGEMSSWYVFNAIGLYPFSPADDRYLITVPIFDQVELQMGPSSTCKILKPNHSRKLKQITCDEPIIDDFFITHQALQKSRHLTIITE